MIDPVEQPSPNGTRSWLLLAAPVAIMAFIFFMSSRSHLPDLDHGHDIQNVVGHFSVYAALAASLALLFRARGWSASRAIVVAVICATLYGVTDEFHQSFVPNRNTDPFDVLVDFLGATLGALLAMRLYDRIAASARSDADPVQPEDGSF